MAASVPTTTTQTLSGHEGGVLCVRFNRSGDYCLSTGADRTFRLWNPHRGTLIKTYTGHGHEVLDLDVSVDNGRVVTCGGDRAVFLWDVGTGSAIRRLHGHTHRVNSVRFNEESTLIVSGSYDATVRIFDLRGRTNDPIQILKDAKDSVTSVLVTRSEIVTGSVDGCVRTYSVQDGTLRTDHIGYPVTHVTQSRDENCYLISCLDSTVRLFDKSSGELLNGYKGHVNEKLKVTSALSNDDAVVFTGSEDNTVYAWELVESTQPLRKLAGHTGVVTGLDVHPTSNMLVTSSLDGTVKVWQ